MIAMKQISVILTFLLISSSIKSQVNFPLVAPFKIFSVVENCDGGRSITTAYKFENDTIINGKSYNMIYKCHLDSTLSNWILWNHNFIREDSLGGVFKLSYNTEKQLYTFNLEVGDSVFAEVQLGGHDIYAFVDTVDSILINGDYRKRIVFEEWFRETWIEGIGSIQSTIEPFANRHHTCTDDLLCVDDNGILIYQNQEWNDCYIFYAGIIERNKQSSFIKTVPNPITDESVVEIDGPGHGQHQLQLFNSSGKLLRTDIFNGKKYIMKKEGLPSGLYLLKMTTGNSFHYGRIVIE